MEPYKKFMSENIDEFCFRADYSSEIYTFWFGCQAGVDLQHDARRTRIVTSYFYIIILSHLFKWHSVGKSTRKTIDYFFHFY
jgi:hypothetical protein